jgi:hypothetical protein
MTWLTVMEYLSQMTMDMFHYRKIFEVMTSTLPNGTLGSVASLLEATLYQKNPDRNHKLWNIISTVNGQLCKLLS